MNIIEKKKSEKLLGRLSEKSIELWVEQGKLHFKAPKGSMTSEDKSEIIKLKPCIIELLQNQEEVVIKTDVENRYKEFPLTEIQEAYLLGRGEIFEYGGVSCHIYLELKTKQLDCERAERIWNKLIERHEMLRCVFTENNKQKILEKVPDFKIEKIDLKLVNKGDIDGELDEIRNHMGHKKYDVRKWPLFDVKISNQTEFDIMHFSIEFLIADWASIQIILNEFCQLYSNEEKSLKELEISFRDYVIASKKNKSGTRYFRDKQYWGERLKEFPEAPALPYIRNRKEEVKFARCNFNLGMDKWNKILKLAHEKHVTPTIIVLSAYAAVMERWSMNDRFCINLTLLTRPDIHPQINEIVGDFTTTNLLEVNWKSKNSFWDNVKKIQAQMFDDLEHKTFSGVEAIRELVKIKNSADVLMPIVFTSSIDEKRSMNNNLLQFEMDEKGISQTPQVFIDCQAINDQKGLHINWDYRQEIFEKDLINDMFNAFCILLNKITEESNGLEGKELVPLPEKQVQIRNIVNSNIKSYPDTTLHERICKAYEIHDDKAALVVDNCEITYRELKEKSFGVAEYLKNNGCKIGEKVAIIAEKSFEQIMAVLGVLAVGGVYVPIGIEQPYFRIQKILDEANIKHILISKKQMTRFPEIKSGINLSAMEKVESFECENIDTDESAYIIFTSGTTGMPKGVEISHKSAMNTIYDIEKLIHMTNEDKVLGISKLNFDLSVYDIFTTLGNGAVLVLPEESRINDPSYLEQLLREKNITVWNSVPAIMMMLVDYIESHSSRKEYKLKKVLLSGDWIPVDLPKRIKNIFGDIQIICMGGATECSIWSNYFECKEDTSKWISIPYGKPLANQSYYILDKKQRDCPDFVPGELCIAGKGVAKGYIGNEELTKESFITIKNGSVRAYRTGDFGYYEPDGNIIFLGRKDTQVKVRGHRIELREIEDALLRHKYVKEAVALVMEDDKRKSILAYVKADSDKCSAEEIKSDVKNYIPDYMIPSKVYILDEFPLTENRKIDRKKLLNIHRKNKNSEERRYKNSELEEITKKVWCTSLGIEKIEVDDSFYELGADSLIMANVSNIIQKEILKKYECDIPYDAILRNMLNNPSVYELCEFLDSNVNGDLKNSSDEINSSNAHIIEFGEDSEGPLRVVIHAGLGTMNCFRYILPYLKEQRAGLVIGIAIKDTRKYAELDRDKVIETLANDYAEQIMKYKKEEVQIIGYCFGGLIAIEVARRLSERGVVIKDFTLIDSHPISLDIDDELFFESNFLSNFYITLYDIFKDIQEGDLEYSYKKVFEKGANKISKEAVMNIEDDEVTKRVKNFYNSFINMSEEERFDLYEKAINESIERKMTSDMLIDMYKVFVQSFKCSNFVPDPYFGDIRFLLAREEFDSVENTEQITLSFWKDICIGELDVIPINGNHITCVEDEENGRKVAEILLNGIDE